MKKQIVSVVICVSILFQGAITLTNSAKKSVFSTLREKASSALQRVKDKKTKAMALLKRYKPKGFIARFKEVIRARRDAEKAFDACVSNNCPNEEREIITRGRAGLVDQTTHERYWLCVSDKCGGALDLLKKEEDREALWGVALILGIISGSVTVVVGAAGSIAAAASVEK